MTVIVYHNPRCSKSRETVKLLEERGIAFETRLYLQNVPSKDELKQLLSLLGFSSPKELIRNKEEVYKVLKLEEVTDDNALLTAMIENPKLIERPIVVVDEQRAKIGRPPESVLALFD